MTQSRRDNGRVRTSRPRRDPDRAERPADGYYPAPLTVCKRCACLLPASERAQQLHRAFHEQLAGLEDGRPR